MEVLGGSFGKGRLTIDDRQKCVLINGQRILFSEIVSVADKNITNPSNTKSVGVATAAGFLLTGPVGGLAGLALGALSEKKGYVVFEIVLVEDRYVLVCGSFDSYGRIRAAIGGFPKGNANAQSAAGIEGSWRSKTILGRAYRCAPPLASDGLRLTHITSVEGTNLDTTRAHHDDFVKLAVSYAEFMNDAKWRYLDACLNPDEIARCAVFALFELRERRETQYVEVIKTSSADEQVFEPSTPKPVFPADLKKLIDDTQFKFFVSDKQKRQVEQAYLELEKFNLALAEWETLQDLEERTQGDRKSREMRDQLAAFESAVSEGENCIRNLLTHEKYPREVWDIWSEIEDDDLFGLDCINLAGFIEAVDTEFDAAGNRTYARIDVNVAFQSELNEFLFKLLKRYILLSPVEQQKN